MHEERVTNQTGIYMDTCFHKDNNKDMTHNNMYSDRDKFHKDNNRDIIHKDSDRDMFHTALLL